MQSVDLPARVSRVAVVPGKRGEEVWAIGHMKSAHPEWATEQTVFLHYQKDRGWSVHGPPRDVTGEWVKDLTLSNMSFSSNGEGWAVGARGALVHYSPGSGWTFQSACASGGPLSDSCSDLYGVSVLSESGRTVGFAVGSPRREGSTNTILKLDGSTWSADPAIVVADPSPVMNWVAVATVNSNEAWAVGGTSSRELQIYRRIGTVWQRSRTTKNIFDNPAPFSNDGQTVNLSAAGWAIAATPDGSTVWVGGGIYPVNAGEPLKQADIPFTLRWSRSAPPGKTAWNSFCPRQYSLHNDNVEEVVDICDDPMPISRIDISSLSIVADGEVFAGGLGLFHYKDDVWWREPNSNSYLSSVSFASLSDGWVASSGNKIGGGGMASSNFTTLGHYVGPSERQKARTASWPHFNRNTLYAVAISPTGRQAIAAGANGIALIYRTGLGWDKLPGFAGVALLHDVAWPESNRAWAVGERGVVAVYEHGNFDIHPASALTSSHLNSLAFSEGRGFAVGDRGTILAYSDGWNLDPTSGSFGVNIYDVTPMGNGFVAVGDDATILVNSSGSPGDWIKDESLKSILDSVPGLGRSSLFTASVAGSGTIVIGGSPRLLAAKDPGGEFGLISPIDSTGSILDLKAISTSRGLEILAIFSASNERFRARRSTLMHFDGSSWRDLDLSARRTTDLKTDSAGIADPVFGVALDSSGRRGWAVGGTIPNLVDDRNHYYSEQTSAIYRFDLAGNPAPPNTDVAMKVPSGGFNFAYFSESSCGTDYCSIAVGSGTRADEVALSIRDRINAASELPNGPKFAIFGGNMRAAGLPDEIEQFRGYLSEFRIPVFGALGPQDLFKSGAGSQAQSFLPELPDDDLERAGLKPPDFSNTIGSNRFALRSFAGEWAPWGTNLNAKRSTLIRPVDDVGLAPTRGLARTHYAFDYAPSGRSIARFVVLDTSDYLFSKQARSSSQNPPNQDQALWLGSIVADARNPQKYNPPLPVIVAMNVPTVNPLKPVQGPLLADGPTFESAAAGYGISAVLTGFLRTNAKYAAPLNNPAQQVPVYVLGGGGAPPTSSTSKYPNDGHYHSWALVNVDTSGVNLLNPKAKVTVESIPVVESVAISAIDGLTAEAGWPLEFRGMAKGLTGGTPPGDPAQNRMTYLHFPTSPRCIVEGVSGPGGYCLAQSAMKPHYDFESENPDVADFVLPSGFAKEPAVIDGFIVRNNQLGFLCTFKIGTAWIKIVAGSKQMRLPVTVTPGFGPCVDKPVLAPPEVPVLAEAPELLPEPAIRQPFFRPFTLPDPFVLALPPVPAPIPAPAPPASAAGARKEEEEAQYEEQGDEGENQAVVLSYERRSQINDPIFGWLSVGAATAAGLLLALATSTLLASHRRKPMPSEIYVNMRSP